MSKVKERIGHLVDDWTHAEALARTGFWGAYGGAGSIFLARNSGRLLLARRSHHTLQPGTWGTIGGAVDRGEKPEETVVREVREELGIHVNATDLHLCYVFHDTKSHFVYYNYTVLVAEEFLPVPNWEVSEHTWFEFGQWPDPLHFGMQAWLQDPQGKARYKHSCSRLLTRASTDMIAHGEVTAGYVPSREKMPGATGGQAQCCPGNFLSRAQDWGFALWSAGATLPLWLGSVTGHTALGSPSAPGSQSAVKAGALHISVPPTHSAINLCRTVLGQAASGTQYLLPSFIVH